MKLSITLFLSTLTWIVPASYAIAGTKYQDLNSINLDLQTNGAKTENLDLERNFGDYQGRCYFPETPEKPEGMILSIRPYKEDLNGPRFEQKGFRALFIGHTGGPVQTDRLTLDEIESAWRSVSKTGLQKAEILMRSGPAYAEFDVRPKTDLEGTAIMLKSKEDGYLYVSVYYNGPAALQACYFWKKRNP